MIFARLLLFLLSQMHSALIAEVESRSPRVPAVADGQRFVELLRIVRTLEEQAELAEVTRGLRATKPYQPRELSPREQAELKSTLDISRVARAWTQKKYGQQQTNPPALQFRLKMPLLPKTD